MLNILENENFTRILNDMSKPKIYECGELESLHKDHSLYVNCINGESRMLHGIEYLFFNITTNAVYVRPIVGKQGSTIGGIEQISQTQLIVLLHTVDDAESKPYPIYCNGSFLSTGAWVKDCVHVLAEAYSNFKQNIADTEMRKVVEAIGVTGDIITEIPKDITEAFKDVTTPDPVHGLRYIDGHMKLFENYIGL